MNGVFGLLRLRPKSNSSDNSWSKLLNGVPLIFTSGLVILYTRVSAGNSYRSKRHS